ncbi:MAG TPA: RDD family protein [Candidatus Sulfotelmatobacter sp.]
MECPHCYKQIKAQSKSCPACGGYIPPGQHLLEEAGLAEAEAPSPAPPVTSSRSACYSPRLAKLSDRFNAFLLDALVLSGAFAAADAWILMRWSSFDTSELSLSWASLLAVMGTNALLFFIYGCLFEASCGATLGKVIVGIRVVRTGRRNALAASAIRNLLRFIDGLGFYVIGMIVAGCSPWRQRLGDLSAGTTVVDEEFGTVSKTLAMVAAAAVLCAAGWVVPKICLEQNATRQAPYLNQVVLRVGRTEHAAYLRVARMQFDVQLDPKVQAAAVR